MSWLVTRRGPDAIEDVGCWLPAHPGGNAAGVGIVAQDVAAAARDDRPDPRHGGAGPTVGAERIPGELLEAQDQGQQSGRSRNTCAADAVAARVGATSTACERQGDLAWVDRADGST